MNAITIMWLSVDPSSHLQGTPEHTKTSCQKGPGLDIVATGGVDRNNITSAKLRKKTRCAGSNSTSSLMRGTALRCSLRLGVPDADFVPTSLSMRSMRCMLFQSNLHLAPEA